MEADRHYPTLCFVVSHPEAPAPKATHHLRPQAGVSESQLNTDPHPTSTSDEGNLFNNVQNVLANYLTSSPLYNHLSTLVLVSTSDGGVALHVVAPTVHVNSKAGGLRISFAVPQRLAKTRLHRQLSMPFYAYESMASIVSLTLSQQFSAALSRRGPRHRLHRQPQDGPLNGHAHLLLNSAATT